MSNVTKFYPPNAADNPDNVLEQAVGAYQRVLIIGLTHDDEIDIRADNGTSDADAYILLQGAGHVLLSHALDGMEKAKGE